MGTSPTRTLTSSQSDEVPGRGEQVAIPLGWYIIWNDRMYASYDGFEPKHYLSPSCRTKRSCSPTLRHRDHLHVSLTRKGARGRTSWYYAQQTD